jgi:hypothetical protein
MVPIHVDSGEHFVALEDGQARDLSPEHGYIDGSEHRKSGMHRSTATERPPMVISC